MFGAGDLMPLCPGKQFVAAKDNPKRDKRVRRTVCIFNETEGVELGQSAG